MGTGSETSFRTICMILMGNFRFPRIEGALVHPLASANLW